ncbi:hypothetical protein FBU30_009080 [Linnemannia zychae]|nr:hypothetical protein FBU30_009080 [Linnemannia zychae]
MSNFGYPSTGLTADDFYAKTIKENDPAKRRRLFADARQSNICVYQIYVLAAEAEEVWGTDANRIKGILQRGVTVFKNPAGQGAHCTKVSKTNWQQQAVEAKSRGHPVTANALKEIIAKEL